MLVDEGTALVKVFLNVSKEEQRKRLQERIDHPEKRWKFRRADLDVRARFDEYLAAYEEAIAETSTDWAPWHVVPADRNWVKAYAVAKLLVEELERLDPQLPERRARHREPRDRVALAAQRRSARCASSRVPRQSPSRAEGRVP